ncbi:barstar family protein [Erwinia sorbitola]|uniref:Ribonuclease inhibitor n=1 Tax=Erwinia sorbitola TaxID=2681984 RepID=A0A6I6EI15_9GAMM|nr:barstar family protein [Erwinia sorbitola]MTD25843.1 ribonuclease inhibitor [Erwinia sorbitola]QGU87605.1 ribonuclease inhibitor [Erwinia sorbitola]
MQMVTIDLQHVTDTEEFYRQFAHKFDLGYFGANLDALWDMLTAGIPLPVRITLRHLDNHPQQAALERIVSVMQEAEQETGGAFSVRISSMPAGD